MVFTVTIIIIITTPLEYLSGIWNGWITRGVVKPHFKSGYDSGSPRTVLYDQQIHIDRTVPANKQDIILRSIMV